MASRKKKAIADAEAQADQKAELLRRADLSLRPSLNAAAVIADFGSPFGEQDFPSLVEALAASVSEVCDGDMTRCEAMLMAQAQALQAIFVNLAGRASKHENLANIDGLMRLALKAQSQCRATIETLSTVKNPPVVIAKQTNIAHGHQQVNNGGQPQPSRVKASKKPANELLEEHHGQRLELGASIASGRTHQDMAAVGAFDRPQD